mmetsp:Transcript_24418/g.64347  ORF Transcript_24418/g.64347 Transcript_24418/m.64347 type:complete len:229 (-) Transcript_24418:113-799(-)
MAGLDEVLPGMHALHAAMLCAHPAVVINMAHERPKLVAKPNSVGWTPLMAGARRGDEPFEELFAAGVGFEQLEVVRATTPKGLTALHHACQAGCARNAEALLKNGAFVDARCKEIGFTPLLSAADSGYPDCVRVLIRYRADTAICDNKGRSALLLAADPLSLEGNASDDAKLDVIKALLDAGAPYSTLLSAHEIAKDLRSEGAEKMLRQALFAADFSLTPLDAMRVRL